MLMTLDGVVKITDFGIAHMQEDERSFTKTGAVMGTLAYMPPEQRQNAKGLGPTADIFAAGASLYALLTGQEPFDLYNEALHPKLFEGVPEVLSTVVARACSYDPDARYSSASEMSNALYEALRSLGVEIAPDYRVAMQERPDGTIYFDPDQPKARTGSVPAAVVESTTINPKETWFTTTGERISDDPKFATTNPGERPKPAKTGLIVAMGVAIVAASGGFFLFGSTQEAQVVAPAENQAVEEAVQAGQATVEEAEKAPEPAAVEKAEEPVVETPAPAEVASPPPAEVAPPPPEPTPAPVVRPATRPTPRPVVTPAPAPPEPAPTPVAAAQPPTPAPPEVPTGPAILTVNSVPRSSVTIDGVGRGKTWVRQELSPGQHRVVWQLDDGTPPKTMTITLNPAQEMGLCWNFKTSSNC